MSFDSMSPMEIVATKEKKYCGWSIRDLDECVEDDEDMETIVIGDTVFPHFENQGSQLELYHDDISLGAISLLKYLFEVFTGPILDASFLTATIPNPRISRFLVDCFHLNSIRNCEKLMLYENGISSKNMIDQILDLASGVKNLDFRCPLPDDWRNPKILKVDKLLAWPAEWFTTTDLLINLDCECVSINETNLKWQSFKAFMLKWAMSEDTRLKVLEISFDGNWEGFNHDGLEVKDWDPEERDSHYPDIMLGKREWFNCEFASDILRKDGLLASFWRKEHSFHFVVWHDRHPIATLHPDPEQLIKMEDLEFVEEEEEEDE
uniref:FBA_2 domain-containing protein n=1 Tax=Caenorhabditis tropicalis TaxID=1561998 RepID=A0A1I7U6B6_9PELO